MEAKFVLMTLELWVDCPYENCDEYFDLFELEYLTEDGLLYDLVTPRNNHWGCADFQKRLDKLGIKITCPKCERDIEIESVDF